jgi:hypothetical protein
MQFEGKFWLLWEDEPLNLETTRFFEFRDGVIYSVRSGKARGTYTVGPDGVDALFDEEQDHNEDMPDRERWHREIVKLRMRPEREEREGGFRLVSPPFDPDADGYSLTFSNDAYEQYQAARPVNVHETEDEEFDRRDMESERFGIVPMFGYGYRDDAEVRQMGEDNAREIAERLSAQ